MAQASEIKLALVDDHKLFRKGLINLIDVAYPHPYKIVFEANNGRDMQQKLDKENLPDIVLMDVNMPEMNGFEAVEWLREKHPDIKVLVVSMVDKENTILQMLKLGVKGYLSKDVEPKELGEAIAAVYKKGYYYTDFITGKLIHNLHEDRPAGAQGLGELNDREREFLKHACSDMTYNEIAALMCLSPKTIDGYRKALFAKLEVKNRTGLALYAVKYGLVVL